MCTVLYIPNNDSVYLVSLRDENPKRPEAKKPSLLKFDGQEMLAPIDPLGKGTWIGVNHYKNAVVLLNGAQTNHTRQKSYLKSRGLIVKELLTSFTPVIEWSIINLSGIEPFTLVVFSDENLFELIWDGNTKHRSLLNKQKPHIWSSSTLYTPAQKEARKEKFDNWIAMSPPITKLSVLHFFKSFNNAESDFLINRDEKIKTISYSFIELKNTSAQFDYYDLLEYKHHSNSITINTKACNINS